MANAIGKETLTVAGTAVGFASIPSNASSALVTVETAQIRYWTNGSTPDSTHGHVAEAGDEFRVNANLSQFKAIRTGSSATVQVTYYEGDLEPGKTSAGSQVQLTGDVEIGAVEIKNATTDDRATVDTDGALKTLEKRAATATVTSVNDTNISTTLLAAAATRLGATIVNESTAILYVKFGTTASATSYTVALPPMGTTGAYYEVPFGYTGKIDGIWSADASGAARITELTV